MSNLYPYKAEVYWTVDQDNNGKYFLYNKKTGETYQPKKETST